MASPCYTFYSFVKEQKGLSMVSSDADAQEIQNQNKKPQQ